MRTIAAFENGELSTMRAANTAKVTGAFGRTGVVLMTFAGTPDSVLMVRSPAA